MVLPAAPTISAPPDPTSDRTPAIDWNAVAGAAAYDLLVYSLVTGQEVVNEILIPTDEYTVTTELDYHRHQAFVRSVNCMGEWGAWSAAYEFSIENVPPQAVDDFYSVEEGQSLNKPAPGVMANDTDANDDILTATLNDGPAQAASFLFNADGSFFYAPNAGFVGQDSFTYKVWDGSTSSNIATVTIDVVAGANLPPTAENDVYDTQHDQALFISAPGVLANDTDPENDSLTAVLDAGPVNGVLDLNSNGFFTYTPNAGFIGWDSFTYYAHDGVQPSGSPATVQIEVWNRAPVSNDDAYFLGIDQTLQEPAPGVLGNDSEPDSDAMTAVLVADVTSGTLTLSGDGSFTYTPNLGFEGTDSFQYYATDGLPDGDGNVATVTLNVSNSPPVANNDWYSTPPDTTLIVDPPGVLSNDDPVDGDPITAVLEVGPASGTLTYFNADGSFEYVPDAGFQGDDTFTYRASDGSAQSDPATVTLHVDEPNQPPWAEDDIYDVRHDQTLTVTAPGVLGNDWDPEMDLLTAVLDTGPTNGTLTYFNSDGSFEYVPNAGFVGWDSFTYFAHDGELSSDFPATVDIEVWNSPPGSSDDYYFIQVDQTYQEPAPGVLGNDWDDDDDDLTAVLVTDVTNGTLTLSGDGSFTYTPNAGFIGIDSFDYYATDGLPGGDGNIVGVTLDVNNWESLTAADGQRVSDEWLEPLTMFQLMPIVREAIARWEAVVPDPEASQAMRTVFFEVVDLPGASLAIAAPGMVRIDVDGAGYGWFVDPTPGDESEFVQRTEGGQFYAVEDGPAVGRMDLLTVVMHELGHVLGLEHVDPVENPEHLMTSTLDVGLRRLPDDSLERDADDLDRAREFAALAGHNQAARRSFLDAREAERGDDLSSKRLAWWRQTVLRAEMTGAEKPRWADVDRLDRFFAAIRRSKSLDPFGGR